MATVYDIGIIGSGVSGMTAGIHSSFEGLRTILFEREERIGGQARQTSLIQNLPGYPTGIDGRLLTSRMKTQVVKSGVRVEHVDVTFLEFSETARLWTIGGIDTSIQARRVILATGMMFKHVDIPGAREYENSGLWYGPSIHMASHWKNASVIIIGAANSAGQAALHFAPMVDTVTIMTRHKWLSETMSSSLVRQVYAIPNIDIINEAELTALDGRDGKVETVFYEQRGEEKSKHCHACVVCIGQLPASEWMKNTTIPLIGGYVDTNADSYKVWNHDKLYAIGDIRRASCHRVSCAIGDGAGVIAEILREERK